VDAIALIHIAAGTVGLLSGYTALLVTKGATMHRKGGMLFVYSMLTMAAFGLARASVRTMWSVSFVRQAS
jgi:hypothetical protein